jgi:predicted N-formylglutamate amidohydrolase
MLENETFGAAGTDLIGAEDPPPFELVNPAGKAQVVICSDHASSIVPKPLGSLGLDPSEFGRHIAVDIGAADVARRLAQAFDAPAVLAGYSRLVIDYNRPLDDHTSVRVISDGTVIPGNRRLTSAELDARANAFFWPYHRAIAGAIAERRDGERCPVVLSIHSYTGEMNGIARPWQLGVLSGWDRRIADPLLHGLQDRDEFTIGDNEPYSGLDLYGYTIETHALPVGLPNVLLEFRQDEIDNIEKANAWADIVAEVLRPILERPEVHVPYTGERSAG